MITTRADLDALAGTRQHADFMAMLAGSIYKIAYDDAAKGWVASEDTSLIEQFGFSRADFPDVTVPDASQMPAPPPPTPPQEISDRQFFQQLVVMGLITEDEAIAAVATGTLPAAMAAFIDQLPAEQQFPARMALQGATTFLRSNPLVETFGTMQGMTSAEIDALWRDAAAL